jgi:hypothetical protein
MDASSTFAGVLQSLLSFQERGDHKIGVFAAQPVTGALRIRVFRE